MSAANYKAALALVLAHEGGYVNHPKDPGGATNKGVTQKVYDAYRRVNGLKLQSVRYISSNEVAEVYQKQYWKLVRGDSLPAGLDYAVFDFAVNSGVSRAIRYLQRLVNVEDDGIIGNLTLAAIYEAAKNNEEGLIINYCANRMVFLKSLPIFDTFGKGWTRRVIGYTPGVQINDSGVLDYAIKMAQADSEYSMPTPLTDNEEELSAKAYPVAENKNEYPVASTGELATLSAHNDKLALKIAMAKLS